MNYAVILLAGNGTRFGGETPKQYTDLLGKPLCYYPIASCQRCSSIDEIILVIQKDYYPFVAKLVSASNFNKVKYVVLGGQTRKESVHNAIVYLKNVAKDDDIIMIHDGDRPLIDENIIVSNISMAKESGACTTAIPATDTIILSKDALQINEVPARAFAYQVQTPQTFKFEIIREAHEKQYEFSGATDDAQLVLRNNHPVNLVLGKASLLKVTTKEDLDIVKALLSKGY